MDSHTDRGPLTRRTLLLGGLGLAGTAAVAACSTGQPGASSPTMLGTRTALPPTSPLSPTPGQQVRSFALEPRPVTADLGGVTVRTWAYGDQIAGTALRATAGDLLRVHVRNRLPDPTSVHWHGIRLRNVADGVPGLTQAPIAPGADYDYEFTAPDPGTYFFHPHVGVQLDRGLYGPLIIDDPHEPGAYDHEWVLVLDDWLDGTGRTPDQVLAQLQAAPAPGSTGGMGGMGGMDHSGMGGSMGGSMGGDGGDVAYPYHLVNGRISTAPQTFTAKPGDRIRLRIINAASDTFFTVALGGHEMTVTHADGYAVRPTPADGLHIGMGERYDVTVTARDGVFPFLAVPLAKQPMAGPAAGQAMALLRTGSGSPPAPGIRPPQLTGRVLTVHDLTPTDNARLPARTPDRSTPLTFDGQMAPYAWGINGAPYGSNSPVMVTDGERLRLEVANRTMMMHPLHLHGHTFALADSGVRKDTVVLRPMERLALDLQADNAGRWMLHCHNIYHAESGMMIELRYA